MILDRLKLKRQAKQKGIGYLPFEQDGQAYNLYDMPKGFVIKGDLNLKREYLHELPDLSHVIVQGTFSCTSSHLTSLEGAPKEVGGDFDCSWNKLTSLKGAPQQVSGDFHCNHNQLTSLEGAPEKVGRNFECYNKELTSLEGAPKEVGGDFDCSCNQLTSLADLPQQVGKKIYCDDSLGAKYDLSCTKYNGFTYKKLCKSPLYQKETAMAGVRSKLPQEKTEKALSRVRSKLPQEKPPVTEEQQEAFEKTNAEFSEWLKNNPIHSAR